MCWNFFVIKLQALGLQLFQKLNPTQIFSYYIYDLLKNTFFFERTPVAPSENNEQQHLSEDFANKCYKIV